MKYKGNDVKSINYALDINGNKVLKVFYTDGRYTIVKGTNTYQLERYINGKYYKSLGGLYNSVAWSWNNGKWIKA